MYIAALTTVGKMIGRKSCVKDYNLDWTVKK